MGCKYRTNVDCWDRSNCYNCGWNPAVERERKAKIAHLQTPEMIIAQLKNENRQLRKLIMQINKDPSVHPLIVHWVD